MRPARAQQARHPDPAKLERIAIMTLAFQRQLKLPDQPAVTNIYNIILDTI